MSQQLGQIYDYGKRVIDSAKPKGMQPAERRIALMGLSGSGKTTALGLLEVTCIDLTQPGNPKGKDFYYLVEERTSGIRNAASDLRNGYFPIQTPMGEIFEADFLMRWETSFNKLFARVPFCETAGEEINKLIQRFQEGQYDLTPKDFAHATMIYEYILRANGFIVVAPTTRVQLRDGKGLEPETAITQDPDVNISRLLDCIYKYKRETQAPPIKGIGVLLTKYDAMASFLSEQGMSLTDPVGVQNFMSTYFKETYAVLKWYGLDKVRFFPSWVELERDKEGNVCQNDRGYKIACHANRRVPKYSVQSYLDLINWVKTTFA